jgi:hypothetical protein
VPEASIRSSYQGIDRTDCVQASMTRQLGGIARHGEYSRHELDEYSVFFERLTRPPFRDVMSNQDIADRNLVPRAFNRPMILRKPLQLLTTSCVISPGPSDRRLRDELCLPRVFKLSQEILRVRPRDPEEVSQSGSIMGIKVVRNLLEEVGKGDRHDRLTVDT